MTTVGLTKDSKCTYFPTNNFRGLTKDSKYAYCPANNYRGLRKDSKCTHHRPKGYINLFINCSISLLVVETNKFHSSLVVL